MLNYIKSTVQIFLKVQNNSSRTRVKKAVCSPATTTSPATTLLAPQF